MNYKNKLLNLFTKDCGYYIFYYFMRFTKLDQFLPNRFYLGIKYRCYMRQKLYLNPPVTYNEKLQWLKLYYHNPLYTKLVDKYAVKEYVANIIGDQYVIPLLGVWDDVNEIDLDILPNQFVLKCNHDSGGIVICKDKNNINWEEVKKILGKALKSNVFSDGREWPYKNVKPKIIAEQYMEDSSTKELRDYKFFMFDGVAKALFIASERQKEGEDTKFDFYDMDFNHLDIRHGHRNALIPPQKPERFDEMVSLAEKLSKDMPHVRVDFYEVNGQVYFGEFTFYHHTGMVPFDPPAWDKIFGDWLKLPPVLL